MEKLKYQIELKVGDPPWDGHGITESLLIVSNFSLKEIQKSYNNGEKILGFKFLKKVGFANCKLTKTMFDKFKSLQFEFDKDYEENYLDNGKYSLEFDLYFKIILFIIKLGNSEFKFKELKIPCWEIGGYELFN